MNSAQNNARNCYTIPASAPFLLSLAEFVLREYGSDAQSLTRVLLLLPNRRACRAMREAFLECSGGKPLLLPRIQPIGELEDEGFFGGFAGGGEAQQQPIDKTRRQFILMRLVMGMQKNMAGAAELARQLAKFMDEVNREGLSFEGLKELVPDNLAGHWQQTLDFLAIISREYPNILAAEGVVDGVTLHNQQIAAICEIWQNSPPDFPIIAAGSTGSQPATAKLLTTIASLPTGRVILPALDREMSDEDWKQLGETHPQYGLKKLLERMGVERKTCHPALVAGSGDKCRVTKEDVIRDIFAPPAATANWARLSAPLPESLQGIKLLEADTLIEEARAIAVAMRGALETPEKTVALITPDRTLARMVSAQLARFGIVVDDSAGKPLVNSPPACFLRLCIEMVASRAAPAALLALLRHPLAAAGLPPAKLRKLSRELELASLRGIRHQSGLEILKKSAATEELSDLLSGLAEKSAAMSELFAPHQNASFKELLTAHITFAEWLAGSDTQDGASRLWAGEAGNALAETIAQWSEQAKILPPFDPFIYPALFDALLATETYRSQINLHPRLHILSPIEARLLQFDLVILASLNEGTWPKDAETDPWMSRPQRAEFGLPAHSRAIGQNAHDVAMQLLSAPEILLTRARKVEGTPTVPSRWLVRISTLLGAKTPEIFADMNSAEYFAAARGILEKPADISAICAPAPVPPLAARPRKLRVTAIDTWLRDPYALYAQYILQLKRLDALDREPNSADFGSIIHKALEDFTLKFPRELPEDIVGELLNSGRVAFAEFMDRPAAECLWWPRFVSMAQWLAPLEKIRREKSAQVYSEVKGKWEFMVDGKPFALSTRIDRLEQIATSEHNEYIMADYKTGVIPTKNERERGLANQLPLEALIVQNGTLAQDVAAGQIRQAEYWKLAGNEEKCEILEVEIDINETLTRLENLIREFDNPEKPYAAPSDSSLLRYNDYEHLERRKEWEVV